MDVLRQQANSSCGWVASQLLNLTPKNTHTNLHDSDCWDQQRNHNLAHCVVGITASSLAGVFTRRDIHCEGEILEIIYVNICMYISSCCQEPSKLQNILNFSISGEIFKESTLWSGEYWYDHLAHCSSQSRTFFLVSRAKDFDWQDQLKHPTYPAMPHRCSSNPRQVWSLCWMGLK